MEHRSCPANRLHVTTLNLYSLSHLHKKDPAIAESLIALRALRALSPAPLAPPAAYFVVSSASRTSASFSAGVFEKSLITFW